MQARNRTLPVIVTAVALTLGGAAVAAATPNNGAMGAMEAHMGQLDDEAVEEMIDLMDSGASVGQMHRWMTDQGISLGEMHGGMAVDGMPAGAMHRSMMRG
jgi:hypothetical protein